MTRDGEYWQSLVRELISLPRESEWLEFKQNKAEPQDIGEYISALANSAALDRRARAYLLWGIEDGSHAIVGTSFDPAASRVGNEELESWLLRNLSPKIGFRFHGVLVDDLRIVVLEIDSAFRHPLQFAGREYIRIGSYKKRLKDFPERERALWRTLDATPFELMPAAEKLTADEVVRLLDSTSYFTCSSAPCRSAATPSWAPWRPTD